jgi:hypothetical protein
MSYRAIRVLMAGIIGVVLGVVSAQALTDVSLSDTSPSASYSPRALRRVDILGVKIGMTLRDATDLLEKRGMLPDEPYPSPYPDARRAGVIRYTTKRGLPLVDVIFHKIRGRMEVTEIYGQEDFFVSLDDADRVVRKRYGEPSSWKTTPPGNRSYSWTDRRRPSDPSELTATNSCLRVFNSCLDPGVPNDCPANLIHKGTALSATLVANPSDRWRLYLFLRDTSAQFAALYRGQVHLPSRPTCPPPVS